MNNLQHQVKEGGFKCVGKCQNMKVVIQWWFWRVIKMLMHLTWNLFYPWLGEGVEWTTVLFSLKLGHVLALTWNRAELLSLLMNTHNYYQAFNIVVLKWYCRAVNAWMAITLNHSIHSQRRYSLRWASASFKSFLHLFRFRATTLQILHPSFAAFSFTPFSQRNLGLPLGRFPPGSLMRTLLDKSSSSWPMTCPANLNLLNLQNFTMSFSPHNW